MYQEYWKLNEFPFENTPNPHFVYFSKQHEEGFSRLFYAVEMKRAAAMLTGVFGCGKTLLGRTLLSRLNKNVYQVAMVTNPQLHAVELLRSIARQLGAEGLPSKLNEMSSDYFLEVIENILLNNAKDGKETLIIIDEAHVIKDEDIFEQIRLLLNFQSEERFLLTIILMGQPELADRVKKNKQLSQRLAIAYSLGPLNRDEVKEYIAHRLSVAGAQRQLFSERAIESVHENSGGIPRRINQICDMCLLTGFNYEASQIDENIVSEVVESLVV